MSLGTIIVLAFIIVAVVAVIAKMIKDKKEGKSSCGCDCSSCGGACSACKSRNVNKDSKAKH